jgi:hypothetical protein
LKDSSGLPHPENEGTMILRNIRNYSPNTVTHYRRLDLIANWCHNLMPGNKCIICYEAVISKHEIIIDKGKQIYRF